MTTGLRTFLLYFLRLGTLGFGGPIALAGHMQQDLVEQRGWISAQDYKEGLALAQLAPGPLAAQLAMYLGWVRARALGAIVAAIGVFLPVYLITVLLSPHFHRVAKNRQVKAFVDGVTAAATGAIAGAAVILDRRSLLDLPTLLIALATLAFLAPKKIPEPLLILAAGLVGLVLRST